MADIVDMPTKATLDQRAVARLRALFDEILLLITLERGRPGRSKNDWYHQARRVADALDGRDTSVTQTMKNLGGLIEVRPVAVSWQFDGLLNFVLAERERKFCQMVGMLEADGTLPPMP